MKYTGFKNGLFTREYESDLERYKEYEKYEWLPFIGAYITREKNRLYEKENQQYWNDYYENTGYNKSKYPIRQYRKENHYYDGGLGQDLFEATESIMKLYRRW